jgi:hypothetical protein
VDIKFKLEKTPLIYILLPRFQICNDINNYWTLITIISLSETPAAITATAFVTFRYSQVVLGCAVFHAKVKGRRSNVVIPIDNGPDPYSEDSQFESRPGQRVF